jgi:energy-coupling factor transporter ATP-binding protein EcfA2/flavin-binding protein dodecin
MKLDRLVLVNWGQLRPGDYEMSNMTLLTGPTGAGKSTMLDGLQTIMTAAYQGIVAYNPGQDEVTQGQRRGKTKRTLESFICGAEYSRFSRVDGAQGYMAAVFRPGPNDGAAKTFTAVVAASARVDGSGERRDAKLERLELLIVDDEALSVEDFLKDANKNEWVAVDEIHKRLKARFAKVTSFDAHKRDYLCALYGRFRGRTSIAWDEAQNAAKAWSQSIAYKPIGSVHELVREDILEFDAKLLQEGISRIGDLMRQVTTLKQEGQRIQGTVDRLAELKALIGQTSQSFEEQVQYDLLLAKMNLAADDARIALQQQQIRDDEGVVKQSQAKAASETVLKNSVDKSRIDISSKLRGIAVHGEKERLEETLNRATDTAKTTLEYLSRGLLSAAQLTNAAQSLTGKPIPEQFTRLRLSVNAVAQLMRQLSVERLSGLRDVVVSASADEELNVAALLRLAPAFDGANNGLAAVHDALVGTEDSVAMAIAAETSTLAERISSSKTAVTELAAKKERLASGASNYSRDTVLAIQRIRQELPEANVEVLCDLVSPISEEWQPAIEGYLKEARFNLIVKPEYEEATINFLRSIGSRSSVVQGKRCLEKADASRLPRDSLVHELRTEHPIAKAYLVDQWGSAVKVESVAQLRNTARGVTKDGKGAGSRTMYVCEPRDLVFGRKARERALEETTRQLESTVGEVTRLEGLQVTLTEVRRALQSLKEPVFEAQPLAAAAADIDHARRSLAQLDLTEVKELEQRLKTLEALLAEHQTAIEVAQRNETLAEQRIVQAQSTIDGINSRRDARFIERDVQIQRLKHLCEANTEKTYTVMSQAVEDLMVSGAINIAEVQARANALRAQPDKFLGEVREALAAYNAEARQEERFQAALPHLHDATSFDPYYGPLVVLGRSVSKLHADLQGIGLYHNRQEVEDAERSFHDVFTKQFCVEIKTKVDEGVRTLKQLNIELQKLKFGTDRFTIDWSKWEPELQDYYGFFGAVTELADSPETVDLFGETELLPKHIEVRDRLVKLLLDPDQDRAGRELLRIADYRNYRRYEIWNESDSGGRIALSTWGTGSGGQLETPAYIVRAAVVTNRMKLFEKGASLRLLVSDESFSKMDETRARAVLKYLRDNLDLQVVSAMPTRSAGGLRPEFDREYSASRVNVDGNGELDFVLEFDERVFKKDRMRVLWEEQRLDAREQARLAFDIQEAAAEAAPAK